MAYNQEQNSKQCKKYYLNNRERLMLQCRQYYKDNKEKIKIRKRKKLLSKYNLTPKKYKEKLAIQKGVCILCGGTNKKGAVLAVDHCHNSNIIRDLLCTACNVHLGYFENKEWTSKAKIYITKHQIANLKAANDN